MDTKTWNIELPIRIPMYIRIDTAQLWHFGTGSRGLLCINPITGASNDPVELVKIAFISEEEIL